MSDYRELLINYMLLVIDNEAVTFAEDIQWLAIPIPAHLSKEECDELASCQDEAWRRWKAYHG